MAFYSFSARHGKNNCLDARSLTVVQQQVFKGGRCIGNRWMPADAPEQDPWILESTKDLSFHRECGFVFSIKKSDLAPWKHLFKVWLKARIDIGRVEVLGNFGHHLVARYHHAGGREVTGGSDVVSRGRDYISTRRGLPSPDPEISDRVQYINRFDEPLAESYKWGSRGVYWTADAIQILRAPYKRATAMTDDDDEKDRPKAILCIDAGDAAYFLAVISAIQASAAPHAKSLVRRRRMAAK